MRDARQFVGVTFAWLRIVLYPRTPGIQIPPPTVQPRYIALAKWPYQTGASQVLALAETAVETYGGDSTGQISVAALDERVLVYSHQALRVGREMAAVPDEMDLGGAIVAQRMRADLVVAR